MKRLLLLLVCVFAAALVSGTPVAEETPMTAGITITDSSGAVITFESVPDRVVSAAPNITEAIFAIGRGDAIVGRTDYCDYPEEVSGITSIGSLREPSLETIVSLEPDVVIASTHFQPEVGEALQGVGVPVVYLYDPGSFEGVYDVIESLGELLDAQDAAADVVSGMKSDVADVLARVAGATKPSVYYVVGFGQWGDFTAGGDTFIGQMLEMINADNIAKDSEGWAYSFEKIVEADPDIVICSQYWGAKEGLQTTDGYKDLPAIADGRLYAFDNNTVDRQGPRLAEGLRALAAIVHPDLF